MRSLSLLFLLGLDIASKVSAISWVPPLERSGYPFGGIGIFPNFFGISFSLNFVTNTGAACGMFQSYPNILFGFRVAIIVGLIIHLLFFTKKGSTTFPLWMIVVGALGNTIDFCLYGHVVDFFHFNFWGYTFPVFNLADSYITVGALCFLFLESSRQKSLQAV